MQEVIEIKAKAKVNLYLEITDKDTDGYHLLDSLVCFTNDIFDTIFLTKSDKFELSYTGSFIEKLPKDTKSNLLYKTLNLLNNNNYKLVLDKKIPIGAGLGGGSSDAAALCKYFFLNNEKDMLKLGSDVPVCYHSYAGYFSGRGGMVSAIKLPQFFLLLVNPNIFCSTKEIFTNFKLTSPKTSLNPTSFDKVDKLVSYLKSRKNQLQEVAIQIYPEIGVLLEKITNIQSCKLARMTGSGSTCFGIFEHETEAIEAKKIIEELYPNYWIKTSSIS